MSRDRSRREALRLVAGAAAGTVALGTAAGCGGARAAPEAITRVPLADLPEGARLKVDHHGEPIELQRVQDTVIARSLICTHQYCRMFWHESSDGYRCPCHGATFGRDGRPQNGPISEPMYTLPARIEGQEIVVGGVASA